MLSCEELLDLQHRLENPLPPNHLTKFYLRNEVSLHNTPDDIWVIINGRVLDLNPFLAKPDVFKSAVCFILTNVKGLKGFVVIICFR